MTHKRKYTWKPDVPDHRDHILASAPSSVTLPSSVDMRALCPPVFDQGQLGSCTGNAIAGEMSFIKHQQAGGTFFIPSRLFIYYNERVMEGTVSSDAGAMIRDGIKSVAQKGVCRETTWPYNIAKFKRKPTKVAYTEALKEQAISYSRVPQTLNDMKSCLASGKPFVFGFSVYESFESQEVADTGVVPMPSKSESLLGGHAVMCVGYDDATQRFLVRNSWGPDWGQAGYFTIPYAYLLDNNLSDDFWTIAVIE